MPCPRCQSIVEEVEDCALACASSIMEEEGQSLLFLWGWDERGEPVLTRYPGFYSSKWERVRKGIIDGEVRAKGAVHVEVVEGPRLVVTRALFETCFDEPRLLFGVSSCAASIVADRPVAVGEWERVGECESVKIMQFFFESYFQAHVEKMATHPEVKNRSREHPELN